MAQVKGDDKERREELVVEEIEAGKEGKEDPDPESTDMAAKQPPPPYEAQLPGVVETGAMPQVGCYAAITILLPFCADFFFTTACDSASLR